MSFRDKLLRFMYGRYGNDQLNNALLVLYLILAVVDIFVPTFAISILMVAIIITVFVRMLSRNVYRRRTENEKFLKVWRPISSWIKFQRDKFRDRKTHAYRKCPDCKAILRLPRKPGSHTVSCPKCKKRFDVKI